MPRAPRLLPTFLLSVHGLLICAADSKAPGAIVPKHRENQSHATGDCLILAPVAANRAQLFKDNVQCQQECCRLTHHIIAGLCVSTQEKQAPRVFSVRDSSPLTQYQGSAFNRRPRNSIRLFSWSSETPCFVTFGAASQEVLQSFQYCVSQRA